MDFLRRLVLGVTLLAAPCLARAQSTLPTLTQALPAQNLAAGGGTVSIDLKNYFAVPGVTGQVAQFDTVLGKFNVELLANDAPLSATNFLSYVNDGSYANTIFHRSTPLGANNTNRIIQGGGYLTSSTAIIRKAPIALEYNLPNARGTLAFARSTALNSATSEWFFNVDDNTTVLGANNNGGYAVFARVLGSGMSVVDAIAAVPTYNANPSTDPNGPFGTLPLRDVNSTQTTITLANFIIVNSVTVVPIYPVDNASAAVLSFAVANNNSAVAAVTLSGSTLAITPVGPGTATLSVRASDANGNFASSVIIVTVVATTSAPVITAQPAGQDIAAGSTAAFNVTATGVPTPNYQWKFNGADIAGATSARLVLPRGSALAGNYSVIVTNALGSATSSTFALTLNATAEPGRLSNLSVLTDLTAVDPSFTVGTVIGGGAAGVTKPLLIRAAGPALTLFGYQTADVVADTNLQVFSGSTVVASNDNWGSDTTLPAVFARLGAFGFASSASKDSAIYNSAIAARDYTVTVTGVGGATGKVLAELYDATTAGTFTASTPRLLDVSVLKQISAGGSVTAGFVIGGGTSRTVLIRAIGPGLSALGINSGTLTDPQLELFNGAQQKILENDNWGGDAQLTAAGAGVGAFALGGSNLASKDAMLLVTLAPGNYTARVSGVGAASGYVVVEVYEVP